MKLYYVNRTVAKWILCGIPLLFLCACGDQGSTNDQDSAGNTAGKAYQSEDSVRAAFDAYKAAILNDRGEEAVQYVDSRTIEYYGQIIELVRTADSLELESRSMLDKFMVLIIRYKTPKEDILSYDGKELLIYAINSGMVGKNSVSNNEIGDVKIVDEFATGEMMTNGAKSPVAFNFYYEQGKWRVDITSIFTASEAAFEQVVEQSGQSENEFLITVLQAMGGTNTGADIWEPVQK